MSCAVQLSRRGANVVVIEKGKIGHGCSFGNAGWMTPCFAMPLPLPGMLLKSIRWLLNPDGPVYVKPVPSPLLLRWLLGFLLSMNRKQADAAIEALVELSKVSLEEYRKLNEKYPDSFGYAQKGLLMVGQSTEGVRSAVEEMNWVSKYGVPGKELSVSEIRAQEPSLTGPLAGGVYFPNEAHCEPLAMVQTLRKEATSLGVKVIEDCSMLGALLMGGRVQSIRTTHGPMTAEFYVLATGSWSTQLSKNFKLNVPILGGKGYSMQIDPLEPQPSHPIMLVEKKVAITPHRDFLRIAGTLELVNQDFSISNRRVRAILNGAREFLPIAESVTESSVQPSLWRGLRPCTPDGVPMIGFCRNSKNLVLACGHQMLGLQSGMGTGRLVGDLMEGKEPWLKTEVFNPNRF